MRRSVSPWVLSVVAMLAGLAAMTSLAWVIDRQGANGGSVDVGLSILTSTYADDLIPRAIIVTLWVWGGYLLCRPDRRQRLLAVAAACAVVGVVACLYQIVRAELAFGQAFPDGGVTGGWSPGEARAGFLPVPYLSALTQAVFGLIACTVLLGISAFRRPA
ncbi:MAG: hypothetical protein KKE42_07120 [Alphaproteobacteria bacterium]|uniref:hypothetical protein n=1 Tax=Brevundimonas sp. TaxID=1871086 RepID=UPI0017ECD89A|nr:hypothetical protein [Brevundimonas sp.]MBA3050017.1 hypothetical protein [Brevundimonas sp.]MBU3973553.1 hypothetical protein [Alphaproteobacteria bacterium]MBU4038335.1 hypothetical protein [Alphaproteobacteria bacterium]